LKKLHLVSVLISITTLVSVNACSYDYSGLKAGTTTVRGESRWTPYNSEQGGSGTCGTFSEFGSQSQWAAVSEPFLKKHFGFPGCDASDTSQAPKCQTQAFESGICGKSIRARCTGSNCKSKKWFTFKIVDVCPADRTYHNINGGDPDVARDDNGCASDSKIIVDVDKSFHQQNWADGNISIEVELPGNGKSKSSSSSSNGSPDTDGDEKIESKKEGSKRGGSEKKSSSGNESSSDYPVCKNGSQSDDDNDGWGWENNQSCRVR
jgi:hypothetical protein